MSEEMGVGYGRLWNVVRPGVTYLEKGRVARRFRELADTIVARYDEAFDELAR